jgi:hypothetical protein
MTSPSSPSITRDPVLLNPVPASDLDGRVGWEALYDFQKPVSERESLSEHALWCNGCLRCWDAETAEREGWRGI